MTKKSKAKLINDALAGLYPDAACMLEYTCPHELIIATVLSAQCTDARVNLVTQSLFARYRSIDDFADADFDTLCEQVRSCGFYRAKAKNIIGLAQRVRDVYGGRIPDNMDDLLTLPGVGRKTANLVLGTVYGDYGIVADTHCIRLSNRFGLTDSDDPLKVERQLDELIDKPDRLIFCHRLICHGRAVCRAQSPDCPGCTLSQWCIYKGKKQAKGTK